MSNPYATVAQYRLHWGATRTAALVDGSAADQESVIQSVLDTAVYTKIHPALRVGGYAVPVVAADLTTDSDEQDTINRSMRVMTIICGTVFFLQPLDSTPQVKAAREDCAAWLQSLKDGEGLGDQPPAGDGDLTWISMTGASDDLTQQTLQNASRSPL